MNGDQLAAPKEPTWAQIDQQSCNCNAMSKMTRFVAKPQASQHVEMFLRNLRLLDLDEEFDWPSISAETFAAHDPVQNQKCRVRSAEWVLYKLLEIWDSNDACKNLQPFFPAHEPLQSANLRAAIFRTLNDMKKGGVFGKDIFIRKSILDDCKGPRFEEILAILSTAVVQKILATDEADQSLAKQLVLNSAYQDLPCKSMLPLTICYRATLKRRLVEKKELQQRYRRFGRLLDMKRDEVSQRTQDFEISIKPWRAKNVPKRTVDKLGRYLDTHWYGDKQWVVILIRSDRFPTTNSLLERHFDKVWLHIRNDNLHKIRPEHTESLLQSLEKKVVAQTERLEKWKSIHKGVVEEKERQKLEVVKTEASPMAAPVPLEGGRTTRSITRTLGLGTTKNTIPVEKSHSTLPVRGPVQQTGQFDHVGQPVRKPEHQVASTESYSSSPSVADISPSNTDSFSYIRHDMTDALRLDAATIEPDSIAQIPSTRQGKVIPPTNSEDKRSEMLGVNLAAMSIKADEILEASAANTSTLPLPTQPKLSLVERTRMSMAFVSPVKSAQMFDPAPQVVTSTTEATAEDDDLPPQSPSKDSHPSDTLADRTRQSMSLMSARPQRRISHKARPSITYPTNQFESPRKKPSSFEDGDLSILDEILPDLDVDYETVFKSRPKIAVSPRLSPLKSEFGEMNEIDHAFA